MTTDNDPSLRKMADEVHRVVRAERRRDRFSLLLLVTAVAAALLWWLSPTQEKIQWQTYTVDRADMILTAMATGNFHP